MKRWYVLYCKRGEQERATLHLTNQKVECYYPKVKVEKIIRGKRQVKEEPLFPSYMFVRFDFELGPTFTTVRSTRGVVDFIRQGAYPQEVQGDLIFGLKELESLDDKPEEIELPEAGQKVVVKSGQFAGIEAIYQEPDGDLRSIMLVKMLNKMVEVKVDNSDLDL
ncbi:transcription/translation regulatory transformer protein RfaH [Vibrio astriarenae]|uniref:transcription/translation regulatory transformer protein RfaH n=1 Tax=Vibrio astriarenae TaxID=1481923 RepID=UPI003736D50C